MSGLGRAYGSGPFHLLAVATCFAVSGYAILRLAGSARPLMIGVWFLAALVGHDFLLYPAYTALDRVAARARLRHAGQAPSWLNFVRVPVVLSGLVFMVWFPLILGVNAGTYRNASGLGTGRFLGRFVVFSGVVVLASALLYGWRLVRSRRPHRPI